MESVVYRVLTVLCAVVAPLPIGTNRALLDLLGCPLGHAAQRPVAERPRGAVPGAERDGVVGGSGAAGVGCARPWRLHERPPPDAVARAGGAGGAVAAGG